MRLLLLRQVFTMVGDLEGTKDLFRIVCATGNGPAETQ